MDCSHAKAQLPIKEHLPASILCKPSPCIAAPSSWHNGPRFNLEEPASVSTYHGTVHSLQHALYPENYGAPFTPVSINQR